MTALALAKEPRDLAADIVRSLILDDDLRKLTADQRVEYYIYRCAKIGADPASRPYGYLTLDGRLVLYLTAVGASVLAARAQLSAEHRSTTFEDGLITTVVRVTGPDGRYTDGVGIVDMASMVGRNARVNARLKADTKAKRRGAKWHTGDGTIDETDIELIPGARRVEVDNETGEIIDATVVLRRPEQIADGPRCNGVKSGGIAKAIRARLRDLAEHREIAEGDVYAEACSFAGLDVSGTEPEQLLVSDGLAIASLLKRQRFDALGPEGRLGRLLADISDLGGGDARAVLADAIAHLEPAKPGEETDYLGLSNSKIKRLEADLEARLLALDPTDADPTEGML